MASLELGEGVEGHEIVLHPRRGVAAEFMVEQRFETSLTVANEGPHLDLLDWKHHVSQWKRLDEVGENSFLIQAVGEEEAKSFPPVGPEEIREAVLKRGGEEWAHLVKDVRGSHDTPASVAVSMITLRVSVKDGGDWKVIQLIDLYVPMGC